MGTTDGRRWMVDGRRRETPGWRRLPSTVHRLPSAVLLALAELEPLTCLRAAGLLALHRTRIARQQAQVAQLAAVQLVHDHEGARHGEAQRAGLAGDAAAVDVRLHVKAAERVGRRERLLDGGDEHGTREVVAERAPVDTPLARAGLQIE